MSFETIKVLNLNLRDAVFGGGISSAILYYETKNGEKLRYHDVTSLYPFVQKTYEYPTQHPEIFRGVEVCATKNLNNAFGLIKCKILPPNNLLFPVLPYQSEKLTFPLCRTCMEKRKENCTHNEGEHALYGTWTSIEVQKALEVGYKVLVVYEIYHFFKKNFMKLKQESSGMPKHCLDENGVVIREELQKYICDYLEHEQVELDGEKICYNPGQRTVMKAL